MVTSRSSEAGEQFTAGALLFSGRPDPTWPVEAPLAGKLKAIWDQAEAYDGEPLKAPQLGYRGCFLRSSTGAEWFVYKSVIVRIEGGQSESRLDRSGEFEPMLLSSAPEGMIPEGVRRSGGLPS